MSADGFKWRKCNSAEEMTAFFDEILPRMREAARDLGYALAVHGSRRRDLDVIAAPWRDDIVCGPDFLAAQLQKAAIGMRMERYTWEAKPHGRQATSFPVCGCEWEGSGAIVGLGHVDLSVVPF